MCIWKLSFLFLLLNYINSFDNDCTWCNLVTKLKRVHRLLNRQFHLTLRINPRLRLSVIFFNICLVNGIRIELFFSKSRKRYAAIDIIQFLQFDMQNAARITATFTLEVLLSTTKQTFSIRGYLEDLLCFLIESGRFVYTFYETNFYLFPCIKEFTNYLAVPELRKEN